MSNLDNYIENIKKKLEKIDNLTETELIRYVYLDLGMHFSFDLNYAFGNSEKKQKIYSKGRNKEYLEESMESGIFC